MKPHVNALAALSGPSFIPPSSSAGGGCGCQGGTWEPGQNLGQVTAEALLSLGFPLYKMGLMCTPYRVVEGIRGDICKRPGDRSLSYVVAKLISVAAVHEPRSLRLPWALLP